MPAGGGWQAGTVRRILPLPAAGAGGHLLAARGSLTLDLGIGRRVRPLGPVVRSIAAPPVAPGSVPMRTRGLVAPAGAA